MQLRTLWGYSMGLALACARPPASSPEPRDVHGPPAQKAASAKAPPPPRSPEPVHEVFCLEAPEDPIPPCSESRPAQLDLRPLDGVKCLDRRGSVLEVGGIVEPVPKPKRPDRWVAAFVEVEAGRVTKVVRADQVPPRSVFLSQAGGLHLRYSDRALSLWRDEAASLELAVTKGSQPGEGTLAATGPESFLVAYVRSEHYVPTIEHTAVRVTSGPAAEWSVAPWRSLPGAMTPAFHLTPRGLALTAFEPPVEGGEPFLVALWLSEPEGSNVERFPLAWPGWHVRELGDVRRSGDQWVALAAVESALVVGPNPRQEKSHKPPVCDKPPSLPPPSPPSRDLDTAVWEGPQPGQGALAVVSHGRGGSRSVILETGVLVEPGHLVQLDGARVAISFCTWRPDSCYLAVVSLDQGEGVLCSTEGGGGVPLGVDGENLLWVEGRYWKTAQLNSSRALKGLTLHKARAPAVANP